MLSSFRNFAKSKVGTGILVVFLLTIVASFALTDISSVNNGNFGLGSTALAKVGGREVSERELSQGMAQVLDQARQQNPAATYQDLAREFEPLLQSLIQGQALTAFGDDHGLNLSKRLIDADIAKLPAARGLDGKFSEASYRAFLAQQRLTDAELRRIVATGLTQRLLLVPAAANARLATGLASPYANMLMEERQGQLGLVPIGAFAAGLKPTDGQLAAFYTTAKARYAVPEQRSLRIARFGPAQVAAAPASEQEIAAYYAANQAAYGAKETRVISQAVVPDAKVAAGIAARARAGASFVAAVQPAGLSAEDVSVGPQTRAEFTELAGDAVAAAAFGPAAKAGAIVGPIQSDLGWHVIRIESVSGASGKSLVEARAEIAAKLNANKRKAALAGLVDRVQDGIDDGQSFAEVVAKNQLPVSETPPLTAQGTSPGDPAFKLPPELAGALKSGFELSGEDDPVVETLPNDAGFALVALGRLVPAAAPPLSEVKPRVTADWIAQQATERAKAAATAIAAKASAGTPLAQAIAAAGVRLPPPQPVTARRIELQQAPPAVAGAMKMLFTLAAGKSRSVPVPGAGGFAVVQVAKIIPGNAMVNPALIARVQTDFQQGASEEYAQQFLNAVGATVGVVRNEAAITAARQRLLSTSGGAE